VTTWLRRRTTRTTAGREPSAMGEAGGGHRRSSRHHPMLSRNAELPLTRPRRGGRGHRPCRPAAGYSSPTRGRQQRCCPQHMSAGANSDGADDQPSIVSGMKAAGWHARRAPTCRPTAARGESKRRRRGCCCHSSSGGRSLAEAGGGDGKGAGKSETQAAAS